MDAWINFIFDGKVPDRVWKHSYVCVHHFRPEDFSNLGQYNAGHASRLFLSPGAPSAVSHQSTDDGDYLAAVHSVKMQSVNRLRLQREIQWTKSNLPCQKREKAHQAFQDRTNIPPTPVT